VKLPNTWRTVRLGDVCQINPRIDLSERPGDGTLVSFVPMAAVDEIFGEITDLETRLYSEVAKGFTPFKESDVLFAKITPSMENGKAAIAKGLMNGIGFGSTEFHVLRPSELLLPEYLFYYLRQPTLREHARAAFVGSAGQQRVPSEFLHRLKIALPTVIEQMRIIELLQHSNELRRSKRAVNKKIVALRERLFETLFLNQLQPSRTITLGSIAKFITSGSRDWARYYSKTSADAKFIRVQNIKHGKLDFTDLAYVKPPQNAESERAKVFPRDILISITGTIGQSAFAPFDIGDCYVSQHVAIVRTDGSLPAEFLVDFINHPAGGQQQLLRDNYGQTKPGLNLNQIQNLRIPLVDKILLGNYLAELAELDSLSLLTSSNSREIESLYDTSVAMAYTGELSTVWRKAHRSELDASIGVSDTVLGTDQIKVHKVTVEERAPEQRRWQMQTDRMWIKDQMSELQSSVWLAMQEWKGTLIPGEDMDKFLKEWPIEDLDNGADIVLRALNQLAGLGLIAQISIGNQGGEYVTGYRGYREEEFTRGPDIDALTKPQRAFSDAFGPGFQ
jgi:type I restriction enzyme, S subunit